MVDDLVARVEANPKYQKLVSARSSYSIFMTSLVMLVYFGFILLIAFDKELLATKLGPDMVTSLGIPLGIGVIGQFGGMDADHLYQHLLAACQFRV